MLLCLFVLPLLAFSQSNQRIGNSTTISIAIAISMKEFMCMCVVFKSNFIYMPLNVSAFLHITNKNANKHKLTTRLFIPLILTIWLPTEPINVYTITPSNILTTWTNKLKSLKIYENTCVVLFQFTFRQPLISEYVSVFKAKKKLCNNVRERDLISNKQDSHSMNCLSLIVRYDHLI